MLEQHAVEEPRASETSAFDQLLDWLDDGVASHGDTYLEMHRRLVSYFERRNRPAADDLADETLNRIARTLERDGAIATTPPARYCYTIAKFVFLEDCRREHTQLRLRCTASDCNIPATALRRLEPEESGEIQEQRFECLERSLQTLRPAQRALVIEYYRDTGRQKIMRRRDLARRLGVTMNALSTRVSRIRTTLGASVESCRQKGQAM